MNERLVSTHVGTRSFWSRAALIFLCAISNMAIARDYNDPVTDARILQGAIVQKNLPLVRSMMRSPYIAIDGRIPPRNEVTWIEYALLRTNDDKSLAILKEVGNAVANIDDLTSTGVTPLCRTLIPGRIEAGKYLLERGADASKINIANCIVSPRNSKLADFVFEDLIPQGADWTSLSRDGRSLLFIAMIPSLDQPVETRRQELEFANRLIEFGANVNEELPWLFSTKSPKMKITPLAYLVSFATYGPGRYGLKADEATAIARKLIEHGADLTWKDAYQFSLADYARRHRLAKPIPPQLSGDRCKVDPLSQNAVRALAALLIANGSAYNKPANRPHPIFKSSTCYKK